MVVRLAAFPSGRERIVHDFWNCPGTHTAVWALKMPLDWLDVNLWKTKEVS